MEKYKRIILFYGIFFILKNIGKYLPFERKSKIKSQIDKNKKFETYYNKITEANKLVNEESNRLISWALSIIGGSILVIISTDYVNPTGWILYCYSLFAIGWFFLGISIHQGEMITRIYMAGVTINENDFAGIKEIGEKIDVKFSSQIKYIQLGIISFSIWLFVFLFWFIFLKNETYGN